MTFPKPVPTEAVRISVSSWQWNMCVCVFVRSCCPTPSLLGTGRSSEAKSPLTQFWAPGKPELNQATTTANLVPRGAGYSSLQTRLSTICLRGCVSVCSGRTTNKTRETASLLRAFPPTHTHTHSTTQKENILIDPPEGIIPTSNNCDDRRRGRLQFLPHPKTVVFVPFFALIFTTPANTPFVHCFQKGESSLWGEAKSERR